MNVRRLLILVGLPLALICAVIYQLVTYKLNEDLAIQTIKRIAAAQKTYRNNKGEEKYGDLKELVGAGLLDSNLADGKDHGYLFELKPSEGGDYYVTARPEVYGSSSYRGTGGISILLDSKGNVGVIYNEGKAPSPNDFPSPQ